MEKLCRHIEIDKMYVYNGKLRARANSVRVRPSFFNFLIY